MTLRSHTSAALILPALLLFLPLLWSCLPSPEGSSSRNPNLQPTPGADTVLFDTLFSRESSATQALMIYNRTRETLLLDRIALLHGADVGYRINVDGRKGEEFTALSLLPGDSLFVLLEATYPPGADNMPVPVTDSLRLSCNGQDSYVLLLGYRQNAVRLQGKTVSGAESFTALLPYIIEDSLTVQAGATLTLEAGCRLLLRQNARIVVHGTLLSVGTPDRRVVIEGLRQDNLIPSVPYLLVPGQWQSIVFAPTSQNNSLAYTIIRNGTHGLFFQTALAPEAQRLTMDHCVVTNHKGYGLRSAGGRYTLSDCELSNTGRASLAPGHGRMLAERTSVVNLFVWERRTEPALLYSLPSGEAPLASDELTLVNCLVDGSYGSLPVGEYIGGGEVQVASALADRFRAANSYLRTALDAFPPQNMSGCAQAEAPAKEVYRLNGFDAVKNEYHFWYDFRPLAGSPPTQMPSAPLAGQYTQDLSGAAWALPVSTPGAFTPTDTLGTAPWWDAFNF